MASLTAIALFMALIADLTLLPAILIMLDKKKDEDKEASSSLLNSSA
jgi:predicted RND superfamily exporter protein